MIGMSFLIRLGQFLLGIALFVIVVVVVVYVLTYAIQFTSELLFSRYGGFRAWLKSRFSKKEKKNEEV